MTNFDNYYNELPNYTKKYFSILYKYLPIELKEYVDIIMRLKNVSYLCGMKYASPYLYNFKYDFSRLDHSISCFLETLHFTNDFTMSLTSLYHDCNTPVFSHVIDYLYKDYINQEVTESKNELFLLNNKRLINLLDRDNISIEDIINPKKYSIVDNDRPKLCIDRLDGIFLNSLSWSKCIDFADVEEIYNNMLVLINRENEQELGFNELYYALTICYCENRINKLIHSDKDNYAMLLLSSIIKYMLDNKYIVDSDLYNYDELEFINIIKIKSLDDNNLSLMWELFTKVENIYDIPKISSKERYVFPLFIDKDKKVKRLKYK